MVGASHDHAARTSLQGFSLQQSGHRTSAVRPVSAVQPRASAAPVSQPRVSAAPPAPPARVAASRTGARGSDPQIEARASRPFGHEALVDESVFEIPAYLRRNTVLPAE